MIETFTVHAVARSWPQSAAVLTGRKGCPPGHGKIEVQSYRAGLFSMHAYAKRPQRRTERPARLQLRAPDLYSEDGRNQTKNHRKAASDRNFIDVRPAATREMRITEVRGDPPGRQRPRDGYNEAKEDQHDF